MKRLLALLIPTAVLTLVLAGCDGTGISQSADRPVAASSANNATPSAVSAQAAFPVFHQGFNHDVAPWIDRETPGPFGWCGTVERVDRRAGAAPPPSAGRGYALLQNGACNDFWQAQGFAASAPGSLDPDRLSTTWPSSGFVQQLDVYLDPAVYDDGLAFTYANSLCVLSDEGTCFPTAGEPEFHYFAVSVTKAADGDLLVTGHEVDEAGWYTFRHVFGSNDGTLTVDFELVKNGRPLVSVPIENTLLSQTPTSDFEVPALGSGYIWFPSIATGVELPVDEHVLRRGK